MSSSGEQLLQLREELKRETMGRQRQEEVNSKLQDEYDVLLKRLAEAELHIDRLRLGAHVEINRRVVTTYDTEQRTRPGQMLEPQLDPSLRLHPNANSKQPDSDNPYRYPAGSHGNKSTVEKNTGVNTDPIGSGRSEPYASNGGSPVGSQLNASDDSQTSLSHSATSTDISLMSPPSIANRASAESMQVAHLFRIRGLREQLSSLSNSITAGRASVGEVMTALGAIQEEHRQLAEEITASDGGQGGTGSQEAIKSELASLAEQLRELEELLRSKARDLVHSPPPTLTPPTLTSSPQHNGQDHTVVPSVSATESAMGTSGRFEFEASEGSTTEGSLSNNSLESPFPANYFTESTQDARLHAPPLIPPSVPQGTPSHLHSDTLTDREDPGDSDHTHSQISGSSTHGSPRDSLSVSESSHSRSLESPLATHTSTQEDESDTHALREGGLHSRRGGVLTLGAGLESQDDGTLSDLSHSCSFPSDRPDGRSLRDPATAGHQQQEPEVPAARVPLASTLPPSSLYDHTSSSGYHSRIPRPHPNHTPSRPHPSHTQGHMNSSPLTSSQQSPVVPYYHQRPPSDLTMPGEVDSGFAGSEMHSKMMDETTRPPTATGIDQSERRRDGEKEPSLTSAAIDALRAELADLKQQILNTSQQPGSVPSSPSIPSSSVHSQDFEVPIPRHHSPLTPHPAQPRHPRTSFTPRYTAGSRIGKPVAGKSVSTQASPVSRSKASQSRPYLSSTSTQTRGDRQLPPESPSPLVRTQSLHLANSHPGTPIRRASLLGSPLAPPLHAASYTTTPTEQRPLHSVQFSTPQPPSSAHHHTTPHNHTAAAPSSVHHRTTPHNHTAAAPSSVHHHTTPHNHTAAASSRTPTVDCSCGDKSTEHELHSGTRSGYGDSPRPVHDHQVGYGDSPCDHQGGWVCSRCGTCGRDGTPTAADVHGRPLTNGWHMASSGFPAHGDRGSSLHRHRREQVGRRSIGAQVSADYYPSHRAEGHRQRGEPSEDATSATMSGGFGPPPKYGDPRRHMHTSMQYPGTESSGSDSEFQPDAEQKPNKPRHSFGSKDGRGLQTRPKNRGTEHVPVHPVATSTPTHPRRRTGWESEEQLRPVMTVPPPTHGLGRDPGVATASSTKTHKTGHAYAYTRAEGPPHLYMHPGYQDGYGVATSSSDECFQEAVYPAASPPEFYILKRAKPRKKSRHYAYIHKPTTRGKPSYIRVSSPRTEDVYFSDPTLSPRRRRGVVMRPRSMEEACPENGRAEDGSSCSEMEEVEMTPDLGEVCRLARQLSWRSNRMRGRLDSEFSRHSSGLY